MNLTLRVWRQKDARHRGSFRTYSAADVSPDMSFLEMLDAVNEDLILQGEDPIAFDHDCREGICGTCGIVIHEHPHGPSAATTTCQLHMRLFKDGDTITVEPWRARAFPIIKDLVVDRLTGLLRPVVTFRFRRAVRRRPTPYRFRRKRPRWQWMPRRVSVAAPV